MSKFKKLPCVAGCPTPSGFVDCNGNAINVGAVLATCDDIPAATSVSVSNTVTGHRIATVNVNGTVTDILETVTSLESVTFDEVTRTLSITYKGEDGVSVTKEDNIPAIDAVTHIGPAVITPPTKYPEYYNTIVTDGNGNVWAFSIDGTPTQLNFIETITTIIDVLTYANKHEIFKYKNESGLIKSVYETVTSLTGALTSGVKIGTYTNEDGTAVDIYAPAATVVSATASVSTGHAIGSVTVDGTTTTIKETVTSVTDTVTGHKIGTYTDEAGSTAAINETVTAITGTLTSGTKIATYTNEAGVPVDLYVPAAVADVVTTLTDTVTGHKIGTYTNEAGAAVALNETVTTLKSLGYNKATSTLTAVYTDENGTDITKTATIVSQATAFINGTDPATATIFSLTTPPTVNDNSLKNNEDYVYVGTDGSYWFWNGTAYVTAPVPAATTEWNTAGTSVDAKGDKVGMIARTGWVSIGKNGVPGMALDVERSGADTYLPIARFLAPANAIVGNRTQLIYGISQNPLNAADLRFFYAGNGSTANRLDFAFSNVVLPNISILGTGWVGIGQTAPVSAFANTATEIRGTNSVGAYSGGFSWSATGTGFAGSFYSQPSTGHGLQIKGLGTAVTNNLLEVSTGTQNGTASPILNVWGNGRVGINSGNNGILGGVGTLSRLDVNGSFGLAIRGSGTSTAQGPDDGTVVLTAAGAVYTLEAPSTTVNARRLIAVKNNSTGSITVSGHIDGVAGVNQSIPSQGGVIYHTNGTSWYQIADSTSAVNARVSARSARGTDVTLDNLRFRVAASGNASLQVSTVTGTVTVWGTSSSNFETNAAVSTLAVTTTPVYLRPALNLPNAGDIQRFLFVTSDNRSYEVRLCISPGYTSNMIHIERLA